MMTGLSEHLFFQQQRAAEVAYRYARPVVEVADPRRLLADSAERELAARLLVAGYTVARTAHNTRFDLVVDGCLRVEVKASTWRSAAGGGGRYQCCFHNRADVVCWLLANAGTWFVIPVADLAGRRNLAIWSRDPRRYTGQWSPYRGAWHILDAAVAAATARGVEIAHQPRLF